MIENYISARHCLDLPVVDLDQCVANLQTRLVVNILQSSKLKRSQDKQPRRGLLSQKKKTFSAGLNLTTLLTHSSTLPPSPILQDFQRLYLKLDMIDYSIRQ